MIAWETWAVMNVWWWWWWWLSLDERSVIGLYNEIYMENCYNTKFKIQNSKEKKSIRKYNEYTLYIHVMYVYFVDFFLATSIKCDLKCSIISEHNNGLNKWKIKLSIELCHL